MPTVSWLSVAPVKGLALVRREEVALERFGVLENRRFHLLDERGEFVNGLTRLRRSLVEVVPEWRPDEGTLRLRFPDGRAVEGQVELGEAVTTSFYGRPTPGRVVQGPWAEALTRFAERELRVVMSDRPGAAVDRENGTITLVSDESVDELARAAGRDRVDERRFRMLIGMRGGAPHLEDDWLGSDVRVGGAVVRLHEQVARCAITTQNPDSGERDLDTLRVIDAYRGRRNGRHLDFGVYGEVVEPGRVRVGDPVEPLG